MIIFIQETHISSKEQIRHLNFKHDYKGRLLVVNIQIRTVKYSLVNVYSPNNPSERKTFPLKLKHFLYQSTNVILGDFNFVENLRKDKIGGNLNKGDLGLKEIIILKADFSIEDVFRNKFPSK